MKSFFFLRVFSSCSFLVTMIIEVFVELKNFMIFFLINVLFFSQMLAILDIANYRFSDDPAVRAKIDEGGYAQEEYLAVGRFVGHMITVIKLTAAKSEYHAQTYGT